MTFSLMAATRSEVGKRVKNVRSAGSLPAVVYGPGVTPKAIQLNPSEFQKLYRSAGMSTLVDLSVDGSTAVKVLIQEVQPNPLTMRPQHVDLRQIRMDEELTVEVPIKFQGEAPAVKGMAGTLVHPYDALTVTCLPADLPHEIMIDLSVLKTFEDVITVADLKLPAGVKVLEDASTTVATVSAPLTDEQLKKMEESSNSDVTAVKTEAEEKKAAEAAKKEAEAAAEAASK